MLEFVEAVAETGDICLVSASVAIAATSWMAKQWSKERERSSRLTKSFLKLSQHTLNVIERVSLRN